jgi:hypothetical protein
MGGIDSLFILDWGIVPFLGWLIIMGLWEAWIRYDAKHRDD